MANPLAIGGGAFVASGLAVGFGASKLMDGVADKHPTGSDADKPAGRIQWGAAGLGFASAAGGMVALATGRVNLGAALFGAGAGAMLGSFGAARLAAEAGSPVVVMTSEEDEQGPVIRLHEPLDPAEFDTPQSLLTAMLALHEDVVLRWPEATDLPLSRWGTPEAGRA